MAPPLSLKHPCFALVLLYIVSSCCEAQDAIQIVARAALCFDNRTVSELVTRESSFVRLIIGDCRPGLMQGVQSIFQMACSGGGGNGSSNATVSRVAYGGDVMGEANNGDALLVPASMSLLMSLLFVSFYLL
ncbi:hypothetical protein OPV22_011104 [Ensete ventricosum]|uniref:Pectinesterase inhibitor domain-containing protein n=1 Tax=Ensete ventricosum TaxID=4639 RepID=A0AAV8RMP1_ENSVE|nr:hypothetical protein OPV22_011104 [Ensete ventricosum]